MPPTTAFMLLALLFVRAPGQADFYHWYFGPWLALSCYFGAWRWLWLPGRVFG